MDGIVVLFLAGFSMRSHEAQANLKYRDSIKSLNPLLKLVLEHLPFLPSGWKLKLRSSRLADIEVAINNFLADEPSEKFERLSRYNIDPTMYSKYKLLKLNNIKNPSRLLVIEKHISKNYEARERSNILANIAAKFIVDLYPNFVNYEYMNNEEKINLSLIANIEGPFSRNAVRRVNFNNLEYNSPSESELEKTVPLWIREIYGANSGKWESKKNSTKPQDLNRDTFSLM